MKRKIYVASRATGIEVSDTRKPCVPTRRRWRDRLFHNKSGNACQYLVEKAHELDKELKIEV